MAPFSPRPTSPSGVRARSAPAREALRWRGAPCARGGLQGRAASGPTCSLSVAVARTLVPAAGHSLGTASACAS